MQRMRVGRFLKQVNRKDGCSIGGSGVDQGIEGWGAEWDIAGSGAARGIAGFEVDQDRHYMAGEGHFEGGLHRSGRELEGREKRRAEP